MICEVSNEQKWTLKIRREESDDWPEVAWHGRARRLLRPQLIFVAMRRGDESPRVSLRGNWHLPDGTDTGHEASMAIYGDRAPWVAPLIRQARRQHGLAPEETGVGW